MKILLIITPISALICSFYVAQKHINMQISL